MKEINLDSFTVAYLTAAFWTEEEEVKDKTISDISQEELLKIKNECLLFQNENQKELVETYKKLNYSESSAGHDFWLTRNGHGVGFWDRGLGDVGDKLSDASKLYGQSDIYVGDDEKVYFTNIVNKSKKMKI